MKECEHKSLENIHCFKCDKTCLEIIGKMELQLAELRWAVMEAMGWNWFEPETIPSEIRDRIDASYVNPTRKP